jgi:hypothetical protein
MRARFIRRPTKAGAKPRRTVSTSGSSGMRRNARKQTQNHPLPI